MILLFIQTITGGKTSQDDRQIVWFEGKDREECMEKARKELHFEKCEEVDNLMLKSWESDEDSISEDLYDLWNRICDVVSVVGIDGWNVLRNL